MKVVTPGAVDALKRLAADVVVLNEYTDGEAREGFKKALREIGHDSVVVSTKVGKQNQVLIASRMPIVQGDIAPPAFDDSARTNFLHIVVPEWELDIVGLRCPAYPRRKDSLCTGRNSGPIMNAAATRRALFVGDFNGDPDLPTTPAGKHLAELRSAGWTIPWPTGEWSYVSHDAGRRSRLDHVAGAPGIKVLATSYIHEVSGIGFAGPAGSKPVSDHAALLTSVDPFSTHS